MKESMVEQPDGSRVAAVLGGEIWHLFKTMGEMFIACSDQLNSPTKIRQFATEEGKRMKREDFGRESPDLLGFGRVTSCSHRGGHRFNPCRVHHSLRYLICAATNARGPERAAASGVCRP